MITSLGGVLAALPDVVADVVERSGCRVISVEVTRPYAFGDVLPFPAQVASVHMSRQGLEDARALASAYEWRLAADQFASSEFVPALTVVKGVPVTALLLKEVVFEACPECGQPLTGGERHD